MEVKIKIKKLCIKKLFASPSSLHQNGNPRGKMKTVVARRSKTKRVVVYIDNQLDNLNNLIDHIEFKSRTGDYKFDVSKADSGILSIESDGKHCTIGGLNYRNVRYLHVFKNYIYYELVGDDVMPKHIS